MYVILFYKVMCSIACELFAFSTQEVCFYSKTGFSTNSQKQSTWADNSVSSVSVGFWSDGFPYPAENMCAYVTNSSGLYLWSEGSCDLLMNYMCQRSACSEGTQIIFKVNK